MRETARTIRSRARGVGIIEALNVLTIGLLLGAVAIAGVARYLRHARTAEASAALSSMGAGAVAAFEASDAREPVSAGHTSRHFPSTARAQVPSEPKLVSGQRYQSAPYEWDTTPWTALRFSMSEPQSYAYNFTSAGIGALASASAEARGDLDGDGVHSLYSLSITPDAELSAKVATEITAQRGDE